MAVGSTRQLRVACTQPPPADTTPCSGDTTPCRMTGVTLHSHIRFPTRGCIPRPPPHPQRRPAVRRVCLAVIDSWEGCRESRRCSRDTHPESYIITYTCRRRLTPWQGGVPREEKMLKGHLPKIIYHQVYQHTKIQRPDTLLRGAVEGQRAASKKVPLPHGPRQRPTVGS